MVQFWIILLKFKEGMNPLLVNATNCKFLSFVLFEDTLY